MKISNKTTRALNMGGDIQLPAAEVEGGKGTPVTLDLEQRVYYNKNNKKFVQAHLTGTICIEAEQ